MSDRAKLQWVSNRADLRFPKSGLLEETSATGRAGAVGFRPEGDRCGIWCELGDSAPDWAELLQRVTDQARKAKYRAAVFIGEEPLPEALAQALAEMGFSGEPPTRALVCDAADDLQPYLDWKGRLIRLAEGKGSDAINARLYDLLASRFPAEGAYSEVEVNAILREWHLFNDPASLRRELIDRNLLDRTKDCRQYWKTPQSPTS